MFDIDKCDFVREQIEYLQKEICCRIRPGLEELHSYPNQVPYSNSPSASHLSIAF